MKEQIKVSNSFSFSRKLMKQDARRNLKRHYLFFVVVCLVSLLVQAEFVTTDYVIKLRSQFISDVVEAAQGTFAEETVAQVGEKVNVILGSYLGISAVFLAYVLPLLLLILSIVLLPVAGLTELQTGISAIGIVVLYYIVLALFRSKLNRVYSFSIEKYQKQK